MKRLLVLYLIVFTAQVFGETQVCKDLRSEITTIDKMLSEKNVICPTLKGKFAPFCEGNGTDPKKIDELKEEYRKKMNEFIVLEGLKSIKTDIHTRAQQMQEFANKDLSKFNESHKKLNHALTRGALVQESFQPDQSSSQKFILNDFEKYLEDNNYDKNTFNYDATKEFVESKCYTGSTYPFCKQYEKVKNLSVDDQKNLMETVFGLGKAVSKIDEKDVRVKFEQFYTYMDVNLQQDDKEVKTSISHYLDKNKSLSDLYVKVADLKANPSEDTAKEVNKLAQQVYDELHFIYANQEVKTDGPKAMNKVKDEVKEHVKPFYTEIKKLIDETSSFKNYDSSITKVKTTRNKIANARRISLDKLSVDIDKINKDLKKEFSGVQCNVNDVSACIKSLEDDYIKVDCKVNPDPDEATCNANKQEANKFVRRLKPIRDDEDLKNLDHAIACYEAHTDAGEIRKCIDNGMSKWVLNEKVHKMKKDLETMSELIKQNEARPDVDDLNILKMVALYNYRNTDACKAKVEHHLISTQCPDHKNLEVDNMNALLNDVGEIISFYDTLPRHGQITKLEDDVNEICQKPEIKTSLPKVCEGAKIIRKYTGKSRVSLAEDHGSYEIDWEAFREDQYRKSRFNSTGHAMAMGLFEGVWSRKGDAFQYLWERDYYSPEGPFAQELYRSRQFDLNLESGYFFEEAWNTHLMQNFGPQLYADQWGPRTTPNDQNFNYHTEVMRYPLNARSFQNGSYTLDVPANYTSGSTFIGNDPTMGAGNSFDSSVVGGF